MAVTATNILQGPATIYTGVFGVTEPATVATTPSTGWTDVGATKGGASLNAETEWSDLTVDQLLDRVGRRRTGRTISIKTTLAEATLANIALVLNNSAPAANVLTLDDDIAAFQPTYGAILLDGVAPGGFRRRIILRKTLAVDSFELAYRKDEQAVLAVTWALHFVSTSVKAMKIEDATV